jgi:hypothetical protein
MNKNKTTLSTPTMVAEGYIKVTTPKLMYGKYNQKMPEHHYTRRM